MVYVECGAWQVAEQDGRGNAQQMELMIQEVERLRKVDSLSQIVLC
jgi:hypothetical protein